MASLKQPRSMENLPDNVLSNIFIRLLAKQLAQMRSVCKPWNALLSDSSFVKSHLHRSIQHNDEILLFVDTMFSFDRSPFTARTSRSPHLELTNFIKLPVNLKSKFQGWFVIGSVNGLICFSYISSSDNNLFYIWNPSLSAMLTLPPSSSPTTAYPFVLGFGYDPKTDDYKVLKLTSYSGSPPAEVYSLRKGSWESISQSFPSHITIRGGCNSQVCLDDRLYWFGYSDYGHKLETIVAFDLGEEAFSEIPLPYSLLHHLEDRSNVLGVLLGKLCVMSCVEGGECDVWVMDEYGVSDSWVKHQVFPPYSGNINPYGFTSHGELLFQVDYGNDRFGLHDPVAAKTKTFNDLMSRNSFNMKFLEYVDSLVWVPPPNIKVKRESKKRKQGICGMVKRSK